MPQHITDLVERCPRVHHLRRKTVTKEVRSNIWCRRLLARRLQSILQDGIDDLAVFERSMRRTMGDKHSAACRRSPLLTKVAAQRVAYLRRDRQFVVQLALAADSKLARPPVDIVELDRGDLDRTQPEP